MLAWGAFFWEYPDSHSGIRNYRIYGISILKRTQIIKTEYFWQSDLGIIVIGYAPVALAWRLKQFGTQNVEIWQ